MQVADDLALLVDAVSEAGEIASHHFHADPAVWEKEDGTGPVTEADHAVNDYLIDALRKARPDYGWLSEESEDNSDRLSADTVFIVDPIDGTRSFIEGNKDWAHSIAIAHKGQVVAGVVLLPLRGALYAAQIGRGATLNGKALAVRTGTGLDDATILTSKPNLQAQHWRGPLPPFKPAFRSSLAYRMCLVAEGRFDAMLTLRPTWEWDVAAGNLIVSEAKGRVTDGFGAPAAYNNPHPLLAGMVAAGGIHETLLQELSPQFDMPSRFTLPG